MILWQQSKEKIDSMTDEEFLGYYRFTPIGASGFLDEIGEYCLKKMRKLKKQPNFTELSKKVGWDCDLWKMS